MTKIHRVSIAGWLPTSLNRLMKMHWAKRSRQKNEDCAIIRAACVNCCTPRAKGKRRLKLIIRYKHLEHCPDPDALDKVVRDALVRCERLIDDSHVWLEGLTPEFEQADDIGLVILLEDLPNEEPAHASGNS